MKTKENGGWDGKVHGEYAYYEKGSNVPTYSNVTSYLKPGGGLTNTEILNGYDLIKVLQSLIIKK